MVAMSLSCEGIFVIDHFAGKLDLGVYGESGFLSVLLDLSVIPVYEALKSVM